MGGDEEKRGGLDLSFELPQKLIRTAEYPFRTASSTIDNTNYRTSPPNGSICGYEPFLLGDAEGAPPAAATRAFHPSLLSNPFRPSEARQDGSIAATMRCPLFTPTQWQELQRQALIYKHLVASVPVPITLLLDSGGFHATAQSVYPTAAGSCGRDSADPEPGRCRRTDGKKWRCTRDAAPDQKYCERHMHRGRPRSRKPVEHKNTTAASTHSSIDVTAPAAETFAADSHANPPPRPEIKFPFFSMAPEKETRYMDWMKGAVEGLQQPNSTTGLQSYNHDDDDQTGCFSTFINQEEISPLDQPRRFIDAWSVEGLSVPCVANQDAFCDRQTSSPGELSASSLTLSMSGSGNDHRHVPQMGGPLGEVLRSSSSLQTRVVGNCGTEEGVNGARESPTAAAAAAAAACRGSGGSSSEFGLQWTSHAGRW